MDRRRFLSLAAGLATTTQAPGFWRSAARAAEPRADSTILVVVELNGGNDGLNTVVPFRNDIYHRARPTLSIAPEKVLKLDDSLGLHPAMKELYTLWEKDCLRVVMNVGYPQASRSHSRSMEVWQSGSTDVGPVAGWLGRFSDQSTNSAPACFVGTGGPPLAVRGRRVAPLALLDRSSVTLQPGAQLIPRPEDTTVPDSPVAKVSRAMAAANLLSQKVRALPAASAREEGNALRSQLDMVFQLIETDVETRVFYTSLGGFDTHAGQKYAHQAQLGTLANALAKFQNDLERSRLDDRVLVLVFSEFGRRIEENGTKGTDHGAAAPVLLLGSAVAGGRIGGPPELVHTDSGDVPFEIDFRDLYASVLTDWLHVDPTPILGRATNQPISIFKI